MLIWGWGRRSLRRQVSPEQAVVLLYRYLHLMFAFTATWGYSYRLATATDQGIVIREIPDHEALRLLGGQDLRPGLWKRFSIFLVVFGLLLFVIAAAINGS